MRNFVAEFLAAYETVVRVDRQMTRPVYPNWMGRILHPELQKTGPAEYDLVTNVESWRHDDQKKDVPIHGEAVYAYLEANNMLGSYLGVLDGLEIKKRGIGLYREVFGAPIFLMRSPIENLSGCVYVPCLLEVRKKKQDEVEMGWYYLGGRWHSDYYMPRFL